MKIVVPVFGLVSERRSPCPFKTYVVASAAGSVTFVSWSRLSYWYFVGAPEPLKGSITWVRRLRASYLLVVTRESGSVTDVRFESAS